MPDNRISSLFVIIVITSLVITGISVFQSSIYSNYGIAADDIGYLSAASNASDQISELSDSLQNPQVITGLAPLDQFLVGAYNGLKLMFNAGNIYTEFLNSLGEQFQIPGWAIGGVITIVFIIIVFGIIQMIVKIKS